MAVGDSDPGSTIPQPAGLGPATPRPSSHAFGSGASAGSSWSSANLSVAPEDLSGERMLRDATKVTFEQRQVPTLGGIMLLAKLGQGGMGAVYYGVHPRLRTEVAVKVLPFHLADRNPELVNRFVREAQIAAQIKSPHLVGVTDVNEENGLFYLVMEFVRGTSAGSYLKKIKAGGGAGLSEGEALDICIAAVTGLAAAHLKGIIHRDIKPDNVLIPAVQGGTLDMKECKLADLGLARGEESGQSLTGTQAVMGTPGYMAPEQGMDARKAGKPADVFSVGAMLYALLCGNAPFRDGPALAVIFKAIHEPHEPLSTYRPDVSPGTLALIDRCLAKPPQERYADASALLEALKVCRNALGASADARQVMEQLTLIGQAREAGLPVAPGTPVPGTPLPSSASAPPGSAVSTGTPPPPAAPAGGTPLPSSIPSSTVLPAGSGAASAPGAAPRPAQGGMPWVVFAVAGLFATVVAGGAYFFLGNQAQTPPVLAKHAIPEVPPERPSDPGDEKRAEPVAPPGNGAAEALTLALSLASKAQEKENWDEVILALEAPLKDARTKDHPNRPLAEKYLEKARQAKAKIEGFNEKLAAADRLLDAKDFAAAEAAYKEAGAFWPQGPFQAKVDEGIEAARHGESDRRYKSEMAKGAEAEKKDDWDAAEKAYDAVLAMRKGDPAATAALEKVRAAALGDLRDRVQGALAQSKWDDAEKTLNQILRKFPNDPQAKEELAALGSKKAAAELQKLRDEAAKFMAGNHWKEAREKWTAVLALKKDDPAALKGLEQLEKMAGEADFKKLLAQAQKAYDEGRYADAQAAAQNALALKANDPAAQEILAAANAKAQAAAYETAIREGVMAEEQGQYDEAIGKYEAALRIKPQDKAALANLERAKGHKTRVAFEALIKKARELEGVDWNAAEAAYKQAGELKPGAPEVKTGLNTVQAARNEEAYQKALAEARKLLAGEAQGADGRYTHLSAEKRKQVEAQLDQALKVRPNDATAAKLRASMGEPAALALPLADGVKMDFVLVPAGSFSMGAEDGDKTEKPVHKVAITRPYYMAKFPVTVLQFAVFHAEKGYKTEAENNLGRDGGDKGYSAGDTTAWNSPGYPRQDQAPVTLITWKEANDFAEWLSAKSGRTVRLATEAEWEHAARAGTQKRFGSGDGEADLEAVGWCSSNSRKMAQPVGQKAANAFGLYDMLGNVNEWCGDNFDSEYYGASPAQDPKGPEKQGNKVYRGGSWKDKPEACRVSARGSASRVTYRNDLGFRLVVEAK